MKSNLEKVYKIIKNNNIFKLPSKLYSAIKNQWYWKNYIFSDVNRPIIKNSVNVYYFKKENLDNVGDLFSVVIVEYLKKHLKIKEIKLKKTVRLFCIGSIIDVAKSDMVVWGSGLHQENSICPNYNFDVRAVRGPKTREKMLQSNQVCPEVYGDPALLLPLIYQPVNNIEKKDFIIIPHYSKEEKYFNGPYSSNVISTLTSDWMGFVNEICNAKLVISGSLHGIIVAEAYNIPAILIMDLDKDLFKYQDYYEGTGRKKINIVNTVEQAFNFKDYQKIEHLIKIQNKLIDAFPLDIWT